MLKQRSVFMALLITVALSGCGDGGGGDPVPVGATVRINPSTISWTRGTAPPDPCVVDPNVYNDTTLSISVMDANNSPLGDVRITVIADLAGNTFSGPPVIKVYDDLNGNGVVDDPAELVSSNTSPAFTTETARYTGTKTIMVRVNLSCIYRGNLNVYAEAAFGSASIEVRGP